MSERTDTRPGLPSRRGFLGTGAATSIAAGLMVHSARAAADLYPAKCAALRQTLAAKHEGKIALDDAKIHGGLDGHKRVLEDPDVDVVLVVSPPGFHPRHVLEAVAAGKHVFVEKPACVDPAGGSPAPPTANCGTACRWTTSIPAAKTCRSSAARFRGPRTTWAA